jgi:hypothetical protein
MFVAAFPGCLARYAQRTKRWRRALIALACVRDAEAAASAAGVLGYRASPDTRIRRHRIEPVSAPAPRVFGVDEFAPWPGSTYATLLVDVERKQAVTVPEGRKPEPLLKWCRACPSVITAVVYGFAPVG